MNREWRSRTAALLQNGGLPAGFATLLGKLEGPGLGASRLAMALLYALAFSAVLAGAFAMNGLFAPLEGDASGPPHEWRAPSFVSQDAQTKRRPAGDDATLSRPLFAKSRRPGPPAAPAANAAPPETPPNMTLRATVRYLKKKQAFLEAPSLAEGQWFALGETLDGWKITEIGTDSVEIESGARRTRLELDYDGPSLHHPPPQPPPTFPSNPQPPPREGAHR